MSSPPSQSEIKVALEALRSDATVWANAAGTVSDPKSAAENLKLDSAQFSYIADKIGVTDGYREIQEKIAGLLAEAEQNFTSIADALRACADTYQREDEAGVHALNNVY
ncbi:type VII secretion target [Saccharopolyspora spinosa]|uniref:Excreted virulence factor EspC (Type VII ESX diderm) n=1 Tax=Saccharopolyspora spinosa TaxID=60894 RepID=A0A2N3Y6H6_SACSN|nr:type VII secretion target [Saccharopolyspora spinosa]PKW18483.1 excreted virulence factor EspC (type VII ESX diderm) [Saccharopolyspora spinosa]